MSTLYRLESQYPQYIRMLSGGLVVLSIGSLLVHLGESERDMKKDSFFFLEEGLEGFVGRR
jgi:hypothetical protein